MKCLPLLKIMGALALVIFIPWSAYSSDPQAMCYNIDDVTDLSDVVVEGKIVKMSTTKEQGKTISLVEVEVKQLLRGKDPGKSITIRVLQSKDSPKISRNLKKNFLPFKKGQKGYIYLLRSPQGDKSYRPVCAWGVTDQRPKVFPEVVYYAP